MSRFSRLLAIAFLAFACISSVPHHNSSTALFASREVVRLRLDADFTDLFSRGRHTSDEQDVSVPGELSYVDPETARDVTVGRVKVAVRGNTSRRDAECTFPKLKVEIGERSASIGGLFAGISSFKIGTHCGDRPDGELTRLGRWANEKSPYREALVYDLLAAADVPTLNARRAQITYVDTGSADAKPLVRHAMLLEDDRGAIERLGGSGELNAFVDARRNFPAESASVLAFAEAMIGNFDWAVKFAPDDYYRIDHTHPLWTVLAAKRSDGTAFPVMYDFDLSGIVTGKHPWFARVFDEAFLPSKSHPAIEVLGQLQRTRLLWERPDLDRTRAHFMRVKAAVYATLERADVDGDGRENARAYLDAFFAAIATDEAFYLPTVDGGSLLPYVDAEGTRDACRGDRIPAGTVVSKPLERRNGRVRVRLLDVTWHFALRCSAIREAPVWIEETGSKDSSHSLHAPGTRRLSAGCCGTGHPWGRASDTR